MKDKQPKCAIKWCIALAMKKPGQKIDKYCTVHDRSITFKPEDFKGSPWDKKERHVRS